MEIKYKSLINLGCVLLLSSAHVAASSSNPFFSSKLIGSSAADGDLFGAHLALDGDLAVIGSPRDDDKGAAFVYHYANGSWTELLKLQPTDLGEDDGYGWAVDVDASSQTVVVGALWQDEQLPGGSVIQDTGAVYAYQLDLSATPSYTEYKLTTGGFSDAHRLGHSVSLDGNRLLMGAIGKEGNIPPLGPPIPSISAKAYYLDDFQGQTSADMEIIAEHAFDTQFGYHVSLTTDSAFIGAPEADGKGAVYQYQQDSNTLLWNEVQKIEAGDGQAGDFFGSYADVDGDRLIVGAPASSDNTGSTYLFEEGMNNWQLTQKFIDPAGGPGRFFGTLVAIDGDRLLLGTQNPSAPPGQAFLYRYESMSWGTPVSLIPPSGSTSMGYGFAGDVSGQFIMVGDLHNDNVQGDEAGAVYVFGEETIFANGFN